MRKSKIKNQTVFFSNPPKIIGGYSIVGKKEGDGPLGTYFDYVLNDDMFGEETFEHAERKILEHAIFRALDRAGLKSDDIDLILSGDLLNQIITSSFAARHFDRPFIGLYGACSTMTESLSLGSCLVDGGYANKIACATGSHFCTAEKQYRFPLELGNQRPPTSQWTITGAGCTILSSTGKGNKITSATFGRVTDYGISDANNMGAAMAPSAMSTLIAHFEDTKTTPEDYDLIVTGDLGKLGSEILRDLMENKGYKLGNNYCDCGHMIYSSNQKVYQGGSGCGCSATVFNAFINPQITRGLYKKVILMSTGALLSPISSQQGDTIPGIAHAVVVEREEEEV